MTDLGERMEKQKSKNLPEKKFVDGDISATVWRNIVDGQETQSVYRTVQFQRRYRDETGRWRSSNVLREYELPQAINVLQQAYGYLGIEDD